MEIKFHPITPVGPTPVQECVAILQECEKLRRSGFMNADVQPWEDLENATIKRLKLLVENDDYWIHSHIVTSDLDHP